MFLIKSRKSPNFISFPSADNEEDNKFRDLIMFWPHRNIREIENLSSDEVEALWKEKDYFPDYDGLGQAKTKVQTIKNRIIKTMSEVNLNHDSDAEFVKIYFD